MRPLSLRLTFKSFSRCLVRRSLISSDASSTCLFYIADLRSRKIAGRPSWMKFVSLPATPPAMSTYDPYTMNKR